jgi:hypothetical protein
MALSLVALGALRQRLPNQESVPGILMQQRQPVGRIHVIQKQWKNRRPQVTQVLP